MWGWRLQRRFARGAVAFSSPMRLAAGTARSESSPHRSAVEIVVADRGPGVPPGLEEKVFERFFRADDSLARRANGSGIGLSLARGLARGMGGDLVYRPRPGGGAEFVLTLPES